MPFMYKNKQKRAYKQYMMDLWKTVCCLSAQSHRPRDPSASIWQPPGKMCIPLVVNSKWWLLAVTLKSNAKAPHSCQWPTLVATGHQKKRKNSVAGGCWHLLTWNWSHELVKEVYMVLNWKVPWNCYCHPVVCMGDANLSADTNYSPSSGECFPSKKICAFWDVLVAAIRTTFTLKTNGLRFQFASHCFILAERGISKCSQTS